MLGLGAIARMLTIYDFVSGFWRKKVDRAEDYDHDGKGSQSSNPTASQSDARQEHYPAEEREQRAQLRSPEWRAQRNMSITVGENRPAMHARERELLIASRDMREQPET